MRAADRAAAERADAMPAEDGRGVWVYVPISLCIYTYIYICVYRVNSMCVCVTADRAAAERAATMQTDNQPPQGGWGVCVCVCVYIDRLIDW